METHSLSTSVYLDPITKVRLDAAARENGLKCATLMRMVLERWLADPTPIFRLPPRTVRQGVAHAIRPTVQETP
jgi:hypothetical protein